MAQVIVRNLDDDVVAALKRKAALRGRSLEQELREILGQASKSTREERLASSDRLRAMTLKVPKPLGAELIREDRDRR